jgi:hypothetical protein
MFYREIIAVCSKRHTEQINTLIEQKGDLEEDNVVVDIETAGR